MSPSAKIVADLAIRLERSEVLRCLGYVPERRKGAAAGRRAEACLDRWWPEALALLQPRGAWRVVDAAAATAAGMPDPGEDPAGIAVCTIGPALEAAGARAAAAGELLDALVLDAIGSAAAEATADAVNLALCAQARARGLFTSARVSPGYGDWDVACQGRLLALLPVGDLGISLTSGQMMVPRKSVSFAVRFTTERVADSAAHPCDRCGLPACRHRKDPA